MGRITNSQFRVSLEPYSLTYLDLDSPLLPEKGLDRPHNYQDLSRRKMHTTLGQ
jgi:hypothetical protein